MKELFNAGIRVPKVFFYDSSKEIYPTSFLVMEQLEGPTLGVLIEEYSKTKKSVHNLLLSFFDLFGKIHNLSWKSLKIVKESDLTKYDNPLFFVEFVLNYFNKIKDQFTNDISIEINKVLEWLENHILSVSCDKYSVLHLDYHVYNILRHKNHNYVIDWGASMIGDRRADVAWSQLLTLGHPGDFYNLIFEQYCEINDVELVNHSYFEVLMAVRRITDALKSFQSSPESTGMKSSAIESMKSSKNHYLEVIKVIENRTEIELKKITKFFINL